MVAIISVDKIFSIKHESHMTWLVLDDAKYCISWDNFENHSSFEVGHAPPRIWGLLEKLSKKINHSRIWDVAPQKVVKQILQSNSCFLVCKMASCSWWWLQTGSSIDEWKAQIFNFEIFGPSFSGFNSSSISLKLGHRKGLYIEHPV